MAKSELKKQLGDQALHALWGGATGALPFVAGWGLGSTGFAVATVFVIGSLAVWMRREYRQWTDPDHPGAHLLWPGAPEWLDPALDSLVYFVSFIAAGWAAGTWIP